MLQTCCHSCSPDHDDKCTHHPTERPRVAEGDIDKIFERALAEFPQYQPVMHSRDPWLITFDNLLTDEETDGIFEAVSPSSPCLPAVCTMESSPKPFQVALEAQTHSA
jgi:prolyl 4-hydroxylase